MWLPADPRILSNAAFDETSQLIAQAWAQLLSPSSPNSYQARALDLPLLLDELRQVARLAETDARLITHVREIGDELEEIMGHESRYLSNHPRLKASLDYLLKGIEQKIDVRLIIERVTVVLDTFGDPLTRWSGDAKGLVAGLPTHKRELLARISTLATHAQHRGIGVESTTWANDASCLSPPLDLLDKICDSLTQPSTQFRCLLALDGSHSDIESILRQSPFTIAGRKHIRGDALSRAWESRHKDRQVVRLTVTATSGRHAAEVAIDQVSILLNLHNLYTNSAALQVFPELLVYSTTNEPSIIQVTPSAHFGLLPRTGHRQLAVHRYASVASRLPGRLANVLESHSLALAAEDPRIAILNLWTAMETIAGPNGLLAIGERVATKFSPAIAWRRLDKIVTYLAVAIHQTMSYFGRSLDASVLTHSEPNRISPDDVLKAITGPTCNPRILYLFGAAAGSPLLLNSLHSAWLEFHKPIDLAKSLERSRKRVRWQIYRIYRARNLLVHRGEEQRIVWRLLQDAQYYVSTSIGRVLHDLCEHPNWGLDSSLEHQAARYEYVHRQLKEGAGKDLTHGDILTARTQLSDDLVWS